MASNVLGTGLNWILVKMAIKQHGMADYYSFAGWVLTETGCAPHRLSTQTELFSVPNSSSSSISLTAGDSENNRAAHSTMAGH